MSEHEQRPSGTSSARASTRQSSSDAHAGPVAKDKLVVSWIGVVVIGFPLFLPTLGSHGANQRYYEGEHFICFPAVGPTTRYPVNMWEEFEGDRDDSAVSADPSRRTLGPRGSSGPPAGDSG